MPESSAKAILIWGGGGHGRVLADVVRACGHRLIGFIDGDEEKLANEVEPGGGRVVVSEEEFVKDLEERGALPFGADAITLALGDNRTRQRGNRLLEERCLPALIHPSSVVSFSASVGRGSVVLPRAVIKAASVIGEVVIINSGAIVEHDCVVSDGAHVSPGAVLAGGVQIGESSWIGAGATVIEGINVGADVTVGAGAVVIEDIPNGAVVVGVPARPIRRS